MFWWRFLEAQISAEMLEVCQRTGESEGFMAIFGTATITGTTPTKGRLGLVQLTELSLGLEQGPVLVLISGRENQTKIETPQEWWLDLW